MNRYLKLANKKLPLTQQTIKGNPYCLSFTTEMGFRISVDDSLNNHRIDMKAQRLLIDGQSVVFGTDVTMQYEDIKEGNILIGDGVLTRKSNNHISSPWSRFFWFTEYSDQTVPLIDRQGWCCTMHTQRQHRNQIVDNLAIDNSLFDTPNYFCYDCMPAEFNSLKKYMFRQPFDIIPAVTPKRFEKFLRVNKESTSEIYIHALLGPWHNECLVEFVPETSCDVFFVTEKTLKPIASGMPFISVSCYKFLYHLRKLGFKTFDPCIDESYDLEVDQSKRIKMAISAMKKFLQGPIDFDRLQSICDHNRMILKKIRKHSYHQKVWQKLKRFITIK